MFKITVTSHYAQPESRWGQESLPHSLNVSTIEGINPLVSHKKTKVQLQRVSPFDDL